MKVAFVLASLLTGASAFGVLPDTTRSSTKLSALIPEADLQGDQAELYAIRKKWNEIRHLSREEAADQLEGEWKEAYDRYYEKYDKDMALMLEIKDKVAAMIEPPTVPKKGKKQRKRDKYAKKMAREAAAAKAAAK